MRSQNGYLLSYPPRKADMMAERGSLIGMSIILRCSIEEAIMGLHSLT